MNLCLKSYHLTYASNYTKLLNTDPIRIRIHDTDGKVRYRYRYQILYTTVYDTKYRYLVPGTIFKVRLQQIQEKPHLAWYGDEAELAPVLHYLAGPLLVILPVLLTVFQPWSF